MKHIKEPPTSGNIAQYKEWALDVSGVENVQIFDLARGNGTVDVVIIADDNTVADQILIDAVSDYIETKRPIGADVQVMAASKFDISISASVKAKNGYTEETIQGYFYTVLKNYLVTLTRKNALISYIKMADLLFSCEGIEDVMSYTLNGEQTSITLADRYFPVAVLPTITIVEE